MIFKKDRIFLLIFHKTNKKVIYNFRRIIDMNVYIVRHGQVPHNALKQYNTADEDLTQLGIRQAKE